MFKHSSKYLVALSLTVGLSSAAVAGNESASPATEVAFAATAVPFDTAAGRRSAEARDEQERSCRPIRRLGGKVKIRRHSDDCAE